MVARLFSTLFRKTVSEASNKQQKCIPKYTKIDFHEKSIFAILSLRKQRFLNPKRRETESEIVNKNDLETSLNITNTFRDFEPENRHKQVPKAFQNRPRSCDGQLLVHPAAPMVLQGGPEVPKWSPKMRPRCQNGPPEFQNGDTKPPKDNPRSQKGPAAEGVALKIFLF